MTNKTSLLRVGDEVRNVVVWSFDEQSESNFLRTLGKNLYEVLKVYAVHKASWLSWLERRPVTAEVAGSSPAGVVILGS